MRIVVYGSIAYDQIMDFNDRFSRHILPNKIDRLNVSFTVNEFRQTYGGTAGNIAYSLALLKLKPVVYAAVGYDFTRYQDRLNKLNIDTSGIKVYPQTATASCYIITDKLDNQITGFFPGGLRFYSKNYQPNPGDLVIVAPGNANEMIDWSEKLSKKKNFFIFDPGQQLTTLTSNQLKKAIRNCSLYIVNDYELALTQNITGMGKAEILKSAGILITTLGKKGSLIQIQQNKQIKTIKVAPAKVLNANDPTGAGDAYRAGLIYGLSRYFNQVKNKNYLNLPWLEIGQLASLASAYAVETYGTQEHYFDLLSFNKRYQKNF